MRRCAEILRDSSVLVCSVIGFPLGASAPEVKVYEARRAIEDGACEIDMVIAVGALKAGRDEYVQRDIAGVAQVCHRMGARLKVILETCLLSDEEKVRLAAQMYAAGDLMGLLQSDPDAWFSGHTEGELSADDIEALIGKRNAARKEKDFATADAVRDQLAAAGIKIEDGPDGTTWRRDD